MKWWKFFRRHPKWSSAETPTASAAGKLGFSLVRLGHGFGLVDMRGSFVMGLEGPATLDDVNGYLARFLFTTPDAELDAHLAEVRRLRSTPAGRG
jgi:hypothetical protein